MSAHFFSQTAGGGTVVRGIRGAIDVLENSAEAILQKSEELLRQMLDKNQVDAEAIAAIFFSMTPDLNAAFPAAAARKMGLTRVPLFSSVEVGVPGSLPKIIRILVLVNTERAQNEIFHVYLGNARKLRPDLTVEE